MAKYKLKKEARQFFQKELHERILPLDRWVKEIIPINVLIIEA